jgi:hypothetical protein
VFNELALVSLDISAVPLRYSGAGEVTAEYDHLWYEIVFDAVVKYLL